MRGLQGLGKGEGGGTTKNKKKKKRKKMGRKRKGCAFLGAEPGVSEPWAGESRAGPCKGGAQSLLGGTWGSWGCGTCSFLPAKQGNATKITLQGGLGMEAGNGGLV